MKPEPTIPVTLCAGCRIALHPEQRYTWREFVALEQQSSSRRVARKTYTGRVFCPACVEQAQLTLEV